ncbi:hypothetical protein GCM10010520_11540 [Rhizobium viscosum]
MSFAVPILASLLAMAASVLLLILHADAGPASRKRHRSGPGAGRRGNLTRPDSAIVFRRRVV